MSGEAVTSEVSSSPTHDLVADVVNTAEAADTSSESIDTSSEATPAVETAAPMTAAELSEAAKFLQGKGHKEKTADGRDTWMKYKTVEKFLDDYVSTHRGTWDGRYSALEKEKAELAAFRDQLVEDAKHSDPRAFLERVAEFNPAFRSYLQPQQQPQAPAVSEKPQADIDLGNGRWAYSVEQNEKLVEWKAQQLLDARLKPWEDQQNAIQEQRDQERAQQAVQQRVTTQIEEAKAWPNWADHEPEVLKLLQADTEQATAAGKRPTMTLHEAFLKAQVNYLSADDTAKRARWMEEANKAQRSTAVTRSGVEPTRQPGPRDSKDVVRETIAKLEAQSR